MRARVRMHADIHMHVRMRVHLQGGERLVLGHGAHEGGRVVDEEGGADDARGVGEGGVRLTEDARHRHLGREHVPVVFAQLVEGGHDRDLLLEVLRLHNESH